MRDTIDMAREAGGWGYIHDAGDEPYKWQFTPAELKAFEALVRADEREIEREACAKECDELAGFLACHNDKDGSGICVSLRDTIRARGKA
jgi:hypothetical protein